MKLNKIEINAIASKIYRDIESKRNEHNKKLQNGFDEWFVKFKKTAECNEIATMLGLVKKFSNKYEDDISYYFRNAANEKLENIAEMIFKKGIKLKDSSVSSTQITEDIIIAQAKSEDLDKIIKEITKKYSV